MGQAHRKAKKPSSFFKSLSFKTDGKKAKTIPPTTRVKSKRIYKYETCNEKMDPATILPVEIFLKILAQVHHKDVAAQCSLVSKDWYEACNSAPLWKYFIWLYEHQRKKSLTPDLNELQATRDKNKTSGHYKHPLHPHDLIVNDKDNGWACDGRNRIGGCRRGITTFGQTVGVPRVRCEECDYDLCDKCLEDLSVTAEKLIRGLESSAEDHDEKEKGSDKDDGEEEAFASWVNKLEEAEKGLEKAEQEYPASKYPLTNEWKKYFALRTASSVRWQVDDPTNSYELAITEDGKKATLTSSKSAHANAWGTVPFKSGVHTWKVLIDGIEPNGFWCALGVTTEPKRIFEYNSNGRFTGYSGAGNIFSPDGEQTQGAAKRWKSGDVITMTLDCDKHVLVFFINDEKQPPLRTLDAPLWPWANGYIQGSSLTLVS